MADENLLHTSDDILMALANTLPSDSESPHFTLDEGDQNMSIDVSDDDIWQCFARDPELPARTQQPPQLPQPLPPLQQQQQPPPSLPSSLTANPAADPPKLDWAQPQQLATATAVAPSRPQNQPMAVAHATPLTTAGQDVTARPPRAVPMQQSLMQHGMCPSPLGMQQQPQPMSVAMPMRVPMISAPMAMQPQQMVPASAVAASYPVAQAVPFPTPGPTVHMPAPAAPMQQTHLPMAAAVSTPSVCAASVAASSVTGAAMPAAACAMALSQCAVHQQQCQPTAMPQPMAMAMPQPMPQSMALAPSLPSPVVSQCRAWCAGATAPSQPSPHGSPRPVLLPSCFLPSLSEVPGTSPSSSSSPAIHGIKRTISQSVNVSPGPSSVFSSLSVSCGVTTSDSAPLSAHSAPASYRRLDATAASRFQVSSCSLSPLCRGAGGEARWASRATTDPAACRSVSIQKHMYMYMYT